MPKCEYNPSKHEAAYEDDPTACQNEATLSVGADGKWHICEACAALPEFNRFRSRRALRQRPEKALFNKWTIVEANGRDYQG